MDVSRPFTALFPALDSVVLSNLAQTTRPRTGREISRLAHRSPAGVGTVLARLVEQGLVDREKAGNAFVYTLNREHLAAPAVEALANLRPSLLGRLRQEIAQWQITPVHASLFGSAARGNGDASSDVDLFIVRPEQVEEEDATWRSQVDGLAEGVRRWTGNHAGIAELSTDQVASMRRRRPPILNELDADAITLAGADVGVLLRGEVDGSA
jgi:predicted nucleotidyltransferase/predicted transcriptional regulator